jgi:hypothetical protein
MALSYKAKYQKLKEQNDTITKETKTLVNHLLRIRKKCSENNLWLMASCNPHQPLEDNQQQGPLVTKLFDMANKLKDKL